MQSRYCQDNSTTIFIVLAYTCNPVQTYDKWLSRAPPVSLTMKNVILIFGVVFYSCIASKKGTTENNIPHNEILGRWCSVSNTADYPHLTFRQDGYVIFDCKIDTVFGVK